ncbi:UvrD-helicase domain-containing protein [Leyella stercorea]|jgi:ATP-dependent exoDNAse (exonuclease V) beta subunit|uniref:UvrD-helicase domain-containing protein n=1 Tax=Leyella stercorea TaxID=363265 RepID=UPI00242C2228|nr:UvrD-helicase domain-containing protein [Leyella stercorea]
MTPTGEKALTVYKASAGSGKTFTLSVEYIKLLIKNPMSFRSTLAVTFTNKATEEMKTRILSQLYGIWKQLPKSKDYIEKIKSELGVTEQFMSDRAKIALFNIVHNYSYFRIETIDSFFQSVLRNLARELDLTANLRIELNDRQIESIAVDEMIDELGEKDELLKWILGYIKENIDDDKNWNVIGYIKSFGENIFREFYKTKSKELNTLLHEKGFFEQYTKRIRTIRDEAEAELKSVAAEFFEALETEGVDITDLSYGKSGPAGYFIKLQNGQYDESIITGRVQKALDEGSADCWTKKSAPPSLRHFAEDTIVPLLEKAESTRRSNWKMYASAVLTLKHLNQLRLLNSIERKVREMNVEANRFLLSDTHTLLHSLIKDTDSPFIFEKIGSHLENVMIDEFQDTSTVQWQNFKVLLEECMSHSEEHGNLIVGDVKQSIYRWRSGDWRMLNNIKGEFPQMSDMLDIRTLTHNYRSSRRVINFNNAFFERAAEIEFNDLKECCGEDDMQLAEQLKSAYADVCQQVPDKREDTGYVHIELLPQDDYTDITLNKTVETVDHLIELGADPSDIAIIVRSNNTIQQIAEHFACVRPELKIVSDEAFRLDNSTALNILVAAMHSLTHQDDKLTRAYIAKAYLTKVKGVDLEAANRMVSTEEGVEEALPASYRDHNDELLQMPIYELAERLYKIFSLERIVGEDAYVYAFFDCLTSFLTSNTATLDDFVEEWNENFASNTIQARSIDGIRLITIHKSKGLEFKHVIIPFCDWRMEKTNTIWCEPTEAPFNELPLVPVDFSAKQMMGTIYERDYIVEHLQNCVDNLNLLYVAFTRAERSLIVFARRGNASLRSYVIEQAISNMQLPDCSLEGDLTTSPSHHLSGGALVSARLLPLARARSAPTNLTTSPSQHITTSTPDHLTLTYGEIDTTKETKKAEEPNIFTPHVENILLPMKTYASTVEFKQSNKSRDFINDEADDEQAEQQSYIKTGLLLHYLFSNIETADDVDSCLHDMEMEGLFDESVITPSKLKNMLHKRFSNPKVKEWFEGGWTLFNECSILSYDPHTDKLTEHRPDRVMKRGNEVQIVDFKFGKPQPEHTDQVRRYISLMHSMGYTDVKGYLWYVYSDNIVEV